MKILVINLDRHLCRMQRVAASLAAAGVAFERVKAVDGSDLSAEDVASMLHPDGKLKLSPSEVACLLSHRAAWQRFLESESAFGCVLEDDVRLVDDYRPLLTTIDKSVLPSFDILKIETMRQKIRLSRKRISCHPGYALAHLHSHHHGSAAYIVSRGGAERLLALTARMDRPLDDMMFDEVALARNGLDVFQLVPALCIQEDRLGRPLPGAEFASSIDPDRVPLRQIRKKRKGLARFLREIIRPAEYLYRLPERFGTERVVVAFDEARILKPAALFPVESASGRG